MMIFFFIFGSRDRGVESLQHDLDAAVASSPATGGVAADRVQVGIAGGGDPPAADAVVGQVADHGGGARRRELPVGWELRGGDRDVVGVALDVDRMALIDVEQARDFTK